MLNGIKTMDRHGQQTFLQTFWVKDNVILDHSRWVEDGAPHIFRNRREWWWSSATPTRGPVRNNMPPLQYVQFASLLLELV